MKKDLHGLLEKEDFIPIISSFERQSEFIRNQLNGGGWRQARSTLQRNQRGEMLMHKAAEKGYVDFMKILLDFGCVEDLNAEVLDKNKRGRNLKPIHYAVKGGSIKAVEFLVEKGADMVNLIGGIEALAKYTNSKEMIDYLDSTRFKNLVEMHKNKASFISDASISKSIALKSKRDLNKRIKLRDVSNNIGGRQTTMLDFGGLDKGVLNNSDDKWLKDKKEDLFRAHKEKIVNESNLRIIDSYIEKRAKIQEDREMDGRSLFQNVVRGESDKENHGLAALNNFMEGMRQWDFYDVGSDSSNSTVVSQGDSRFLDGVMSGYLEGAGDAFNNHANNDAIFSNAQKELSIKYSSAGRRVLDAESSLSDQCFNRGIYSGFYKVKRSVELNVEVDSRGNGFWYNQVSDNNANIKRSRGI